ncbi:MAG: cyclic nucleotide-binding domain-containing protein [Deltaproteobacteria bacterium]|nr:cyclic nucleotide-binding domain-containing protein [Deltaproteobacteria bacterium]
MDVGSLLSAYMADQETYKSGDVIIEEGTKGDWVYIVLEGQVKVTKRTAVGMLTIDVLKKGSIFGEMALFGKALQARSASVIAADGDVRVGVFETSQLIEDYESLSLELRSVIKALIMGLKESNEKAAALVVAANEKGQKN